MMRRVTVTLPADQGQVLVETEGEHCHVALRMDETDLWVPIVLTGGDYDDELPGPSKITEHWTMLTWWLLAVTALVVLVFAVAWRVT